MLGSIGCCILTTCVLVHRYGKIHEVLLRNDSGKTIDNIRVGIKYGSATISTLKAAESARISFLDNGEGGYSVTYPYDATDPFVGECGYSGILPALREKVIVRITTDGIECESLNSGE